MSSSHAISSEVGPPLHIVMEEVAHAAMYRLTRPGTVGNEIPCQRPWSSLPELSPILSPPHDEMAREALKKNFLTQLSNNKEWEGESSTYFLKANAIK
ncbi:hypothetical protein Trydic_g41 [Trypoxylus dichotomus]